MVFFDGSWTVLNKINYSGTNVSYSDDFQLEFWIIFSIMPSSGDFTKTLESRTIKFIT